MTTPITKSINFKRGDTLLDESGIVLDFLLDGYIWKV